MKVTSGEFKGRNLINNHFEHIRPTADMVKQSIFNKLGAKLFGAKVLDLFCGTGALGIEALSRGAESCIFVDKDKRSVGLTQSNLNNLKIDAKVVNLPYEKALAKFNGQKFDIIILDPPYREGLYEDALLKIKENNLLAEDGIIVCEQAKDVKIDYSVFELQDYRTYGIKGVAYLVNKR